MKRFYAAGLAYIFTIATIFAFLFIFPAVGTAASGETVYIIPVKGEITPAMAIFLKDSISKANNAGAKGIIIEITTLGGRVDSALEMKEAIMASKIPVAVYVEERAISAGALITIAAPKIFMAPGSHIGSAEPIPYSEKSVAFVRGEFQAAAKRWGRNEQIAQAMVDKNIEISGLSPKGSLLDIDAYTAHQYGFIDAVLEDIESVVKYLGYDGMTIVNIVPSLGVRAAQFLTRSDVASVLLIVAVIAILAELFIQGFGLPGIIGIISLGLYFGGSYLAGYAEWWAIALFLVGGILLIAELYVPGGILGVAGLASILLGLALAAPDIVQGIKYVIVVAGAALVSIPMLFYIFGRMRTFDKIVLSDTIGGDDKEKVGKEDSSKWLGQTGTVISALRPSGRIQIDEDRLDVISDGEYLQPGTKVRVVKVEGVSIVVTRVE